MIFKKTLIDSIKNNKVQGVVPNGKILGNLMKK